ncbi:hypothetical protein RQP46_003713 [Phenoliferia psychrophenolica]
MLINDFFAALLAIVFVLNLGTLYCQTSYDRKNYTIILYCDWALVSTADTLINLLIWHDNADARLAEFCSRSAEVGCATYRVVNIRLFGVVGDSFNQRADSNGHGLTPSLYRRFAYFTWAMTLVMLFLVPQGIVAGLRLAQFFPDFVTLKANPTWRAPDIIHGNRPTQVGGVEFANFFVAAMVFGFFGLGADANEQYKKVPMKIYALYLHVAQNQNAQAFLTVLSWARNASRPAWVGITYGFDLVGSHLASATYSIGKLLWALIVLVPSTFFRVYASLNVAWGNGGKIHKE